MFPPDAVQLYNHYIALEWLYMVKLRPCFCVSLPQTAQMVPPNLENAVLHSPWHQHPKSGHHLYIAI